MRARRPRAGFGLVLLLALVGCRSLVTDPPASAQARHGLVRAENAEAAGRRVALLDGICESLLAQVPGLHEVPLELWILDRGSSSSDEAFWSTRDAVSLEVDGVAVIALAARDERDEPMLVAHELGHVLAGRVWQNMKPPYREGLAEVIGLRFGGPGAARSHCSRLVAAAHAEGGLRLELAFAAAGPQRLEWRPSYHPPAGPGLLMWDNWEPSEQNIARATVLIDLTVDRMGWEGLHAFCVMSAEGDRAGWLDDAALQCLAGVRAGGPEWLAALESRLGEAELRYMAEVEAPAIAERLLPACRLTFGPVAADVFLARAAPRLGVTGGRSVALADVPEARAALVAAWDAGKP